MRRATEARRCSLQSFWLQELMAGPTRLELATSGVTGRRSNQLNYDPAKGLKVKVDSRHVSPARRPSRSSPEASEGWAVQDSNL